MVEVLETEAEETDLWDGGGSRTAGAGAGCLVLWANRASARVRASEVSVPFPWCSACVPFLVLCVESCVVPGGVVDLSRLRGQVGYPAVVYFSSKTCRCACWRHLMVPKNHCWMPGMSSSVSWG